MAPPHKDPSPIVPKQTAPRGLPQAVQAAGLPQGSTHVPLLSPTLPGSQHTSLEQLPLQHWLAVASVQEPPFGIHEGWHIPLSHSSPSSQGLKQLPQCLSFLWRFTHLPSPRGFLQRVLSSGQPQTLSSPRPMQFLEQHWESLLHSRPKRLQPSAQATPGMDANAPPTRATPISRSALPLERVPVASPLASSSKDWLVVCRLTYCPFPKRARH